MLIRQIYAGNSHRNFHYLIACPETREALAIDPLLAPLCLDAAERQGWKITQILNTHEHWDHTGGNADMIAATGAKLLAHYGAGDKIPHVDIGLKAGDIVKVGKTVRLKVLDTPGHTMSHICLLSLPEATGGSFEPALFCGDTLFNAGAGNCKGGGHPEELYETFARQLATLPDNTRIFPGHDYIVNNLAFTLDREPDNEAARRLLARVKDQDPHNPLITTLGQEREINSFFRLNSPTILKNLALEIPEFPQKPTEKDVFIALRELRNHW